MAEVGNLFMESYKIKYFVGWLWFKKEAFIWLAALTWLALADPSGHHYSICPLHNLGFSFCPGCGLGRSIGYFFRLDPVSSFQAHPLGILAVILLIYRIIRVFNRKSDIQISIN